VFCWFGTYQPIKPDQQCWEITNDTQNTVRRQTHNIDRWLKMHWTSYFTNCLNVLWFGYCKFVILLLHLHTVSRSISLCYFIHCFRKKFKEFFVSSEIWDTVCTGGGSTISFVRKNIGFVMGFASFPLENETIAWSGNYRRNCFRYI